MIITTAGRSPSELVGRAKRLSATYRVPYIERNGLSIEALKERFQEDVVVVGKERLFIAPLHEEDYLFFHPNIAMIRARRLFKGEGEPLIQAAKLEKGMSFLDCTLGLASDSIVASIAVGVGGNVIGVEGNPLLFLLVKEGLAAFASGNGLMDEAMRAIKVVHDNHYNYLKNAKTNSVDVVYFDPMFPTAIETSDGINAIRGQALTTGLTIELINEAKRVARKRIILKDHWKSERFADLGFTQQKRKTSLFHYGIIELDNS